MERLCCNKFFYMLIINEVNEIEIIYYKKLVCKKLCMVVFS